jgi:capsular polysaccharide transport system permease protein
MAVVVIPTLLAAVYFGLVESPIYQSNAEFLIQQANETSTLNGLGQFLQSTGISTTSNQSYTVNSYLLSRDAVGDLQKKINLRAIYDRPNADFLNRFPNFIFGPSFENLFNHYNEWASVNFDSGSGITTLTVTAFRPSDAHAVAESLLLLSEAEVNRLNDRVRNDTLRAARREVTTLQNRLLDIQNQITAFRNRQHLLDPAESSTQAVSLVSSVETQLVEARAALKQTEVTTPHSPELPALREKVDALQAQSASEAYKGAGSSTSLAPKLSEYQALLLKQQFVQQMLQSAVTALESAEATVQQQQLYLSRVAEPSTPDAPYFPFRHPIEILVFTVSVLMIYGIGKMIQGAVAEHMGRD